MDLHHRAAFKMESSSYLPGPLASPALMVLASTADASRDASAPCQQPRPFGAPVSVSDKDVHLPFANGSYAFASVYHRQPGFGGRDFAPSLLHLHHQFAPPGLDCPPSISVLNHGAVGAFRPFASPPEERDAASGAYQSAFTPAKRLKGCLEAEASPHLRYSDAEGKEYDYGGAHVPSGSPGALKAVEDAGKKIFAVSGLLSDREASSSPEDRTERSREKLLHAASFPPPPLPSRLFLALPLMRRRPMCHSGKKKVSLYDSQAPICPICQVLLRPGELQEHMEQEMERLTHLHISKNPSPKDLSTAPGTPKSLLLSVHIKREGESPVISPLSSDDPHHSDRYQTFLRVRANRQTRLNARIGKLKRRKPEDGQVCPLCSAPLEGTVEEMNKHVEECLLKREGGIEDDQADMEGENGTRFEEYEWCGQKRIRATSLLEGGFRGTGFAMCSAKESHDSDADLDVDGDDTLEYGKAQCRYTEADIIPCSGEDQGETKEREALRGAVLNGGMPSNRITPEFSKWASDVHSLRGGVCVSAEMPSTSNGESSKQEASSASTSTVPRTCKNSEIENVSDFYNWPAPALNANLFAPSKAFRRLSPFPSRITEDSTGTTLEALKARIRELEKQILRGDRYKCLICMDSYTAPLTSIQCWHVHCEECWLRTLGNKKLCPQCNTITSPGDLRRVYL
ncbi:E3 ubiquitin-protein ligase RNF220a isoform X5 [Tachysurus fulvidraco]|uniref:E3 ubiquitin-protein ligase RNF220a isoform X5 n=1 Tax=Tachysurus fulvidraco TaxID=1234273 RepID=UPI001FED792A|nr:E3 ubiquitin-protein ligase RNF220a isoform X5 [Tachysurus fulvidraco]